LAVHIKGIIVKQEALQMALKSQGENAKILNSGKILPLIE